MWSKLLTAVTLLHLTRASPKPSHPASSTPIDWQGCKPDIPGLQCGQYEVPLDWAKPNGTQITIAVSRVKATNPSKRLGSLVMNPGGPGGSSIYCQYQASGLAKLFADTAIEHYDMVCFDPRGVGKSAPIRCDPGIYNQRVSQFPADKASHEQVLNWSKAFGQSCLNLSGDIFKHVDTTSVARDMEALRVGLGEGKLNWIGLSYGTMIGLQYAELFPQNVGKMVLDGVDDHSAAEIYTVLGETGAYERELVRFFDWCQSNTTCALYGTDVASIYDDLVAQAERSPIPAPGCLASADTISAGTCFPNVTGEDLRFNPQGRLVYKEPNQLSTDGWGALGQALNETMHGNATLLSSAMATSQNDTVWQGLAIGCLDWLHTAKSFRDMEHKIIWLNGTAPHTKGANQSWSYQTLCLGWPAAVQNPQHVWNQTAMKMAPPILFMQSVWDPEASDAWALEAFHQSPTGTMVTRDGDGHLTYPLKGEGSRIIDAYLVNGTMPQKGLVIYS